jgi:Ca2+-binding EF-hand superfamily protein
LVQLLRENEHELYYMVKNVFRYDRNDDGKVTYDELTDFCVEQHFGEMAIQRLHRKKGNYSRWDKREMNKQEFQMTLSYALKPIDIQAPQSVIDLLWSEIDLNKSGWITYQVYFLFLKYYFGSQNVVFTKNTELDEWDQWFLTLKGLGPLDYFVRLILDQLRKIFLMYDSNKNLVFEIDEIETILKSVFQLDESEVAYVIYSYFKFEARKDKFATFEELVAIILEVFFIEIVIKRKYKEETSGLRFSLQNFIDLIRDNTFFLRFRPENDLLTKVFQIIDTNRDNWITLVEYMNFIRQYLGRGLIIVDESPKKIKDQPKPSSVPGVSSEELAFIELIWTELKKYFEKYDIGSKGYLNETEIKAFVIEVLQETSQKELDYVFWNIFRVDPDGNRQIEFE